MAMGGEHDRCDGVYSIKQMDDEPRRLEFSWGSKGKKGSVGRPWVWLADKMGCVESVFGQDCCGSTEETNGRKKAMEWRSMSVEESEGGNVVGKIHKKKIGKGGHGVVN